MQRSRADEDQRLRARWVVDEGWVVGRGSRGADAMEHGDPRAVRTGDGGRMDAVYDERDAGMDSPRWKRSETA